MTRRLLALLVMLTVRVLSVVPRLLVPLDMLSLIARVLQVIVLGVSLLMGVRRRCWAWALATPGAGLGGRLRSVGSPVMPVVVASGVWACPRLSRRGGAGGGVGACDGVVDVGEFCGCRCFTELCRG